MNRFGTKKWKTECAKFKSPVNRDHFEATERASHMNIVCFPSPGIFIAMRFNFLLSALAFIRKIYGTEIWNNP